MAGLKRSGSQALATYGGKVFFDFLGVIELIDMSTYFDDGEVWYELVEHLDPDRRLETLLVPEAELHALRNGIPERKRTPRL